MVCKGYNGNIISRQSSSLLPLGGSCRKLHVSQFVWLSSGGPNGSLRAPGPPGSNTETMLLNNSHLSLRQPRLPCAPDAQYFIKQRFIVAEKMIEKGNGLNGSTIIALISVNSTQFITWIFSVKIFEDEINVFLLIQPSEQMGLSFIVPFRSMKCRNIT